MGGCIQGGYRDSACPGWPCPIHTRQAYLLGSPDPPLEHCVHPPLTQQQEQVSLSHPPFTYHSLIHPCVHLSVCVHTQPPKSVGLWTSTHGQVCLPCTTVWILALIHHISTQILSRSPQVQVSRELYLYPGFCHDVIPGSKQSFPVVSLETYRCPGPCFYGCLVVLLWLGSLTTILGKKRGSQHSMLIDVMRARKALTTSVTHLPQWHLMILEDSQENEV